MARGWESKNIEAQVEEREAARAAAATGGGSPAKAADAGARQRRQELEGWRLSRLEVARQLETVDAPARRQALQTALAYLDARIAGASRPARQK